MPAPFTRHATALIAAACLSLAASAPANATILTFGMEFPGQYPVSEDFPEGFQIDQTYGDRVTATSAPVIGGTFFYGVGAEGFTPNIQVGYGPTSIFTGGPSLWRYDYDDLDRVLYQGSRQADPNNPVGIDYDYLEILLFADPGFDVVLHGFQLGGGFNTDFTINAVSVYDDFFNGFFPEDDRVFHDPNALVRGAGPDPSTYTFGTPIRGPVITILIDANNLGPDSDLIGIDNIIFGQDVAQAQIPEPAGLLLLGGGLLGLGVVRRIRRR
jgi:hypothetical protein